MLADQGLGGHFIASEREREREREGGLEWNALEVRHCLGRGDEEDGGYKGAKEAAAAALFCPHKS